MGTRWSVHLVLAYGAPTAVLWASIQAQLDALVEQMSSWDPKSVLSRYNDADADSWHSLPADCAEVVERALQFARDSDGAYDPAIGALVDAWGFGSAPRREAPPAAAQINALRARSGWQRLRYDAAARQLYQPGGLRLDLSAIAKGYAVDRLAALIRAQGVRHFLVEVGGELYGEGCKPDGQPWWVALEEPEGQAVGQGLPETIVVALDGLAVATSGDYRQSFHYAQRRYSHTLDPRNGWPVAHHLASVTVLHARCIDADALATLLMVLGLEQGMLYAQRRQLAARFVVRAPDDATPHWQESLSPALLRLTQ
jgi:thiamine biosynthesis lipoprotein